MGAPVLINARWYETFLKAAAAVGGRPSHCLALEDSYNGIRAATAAGMVTVLVPDMLPPTEEIRHLGVSVAPSLHYVLSDLQSSIQAQSAGSCENGQLKKQTGKL